MAQISINDRPLRRDFSKIKKIVDIPNLIDVQKRSFESFLQPNVDPNERRNIGLQGVFKDVFPIKDFNETASLQFVRYEIGGPKYDVDECHQRGMTYAAPVKVTIRLVIWDKDEESNIQSIRTIKEQDVYFGEIPLMTDNGTFIINGTERVIVSQLHRSPGVFFDHDKGKSHSSGKLLYSARIIPYRGSWVDIEFDPKDILHVRIDRRRKLPATVLLKALGYGTEELLNYFYDTERVFFDGKTLEKEVKFNLLLGQRASKDIRDPKSGDLLIKKDRRITRLGIKKLRTAGLQMIPITVEEILGRIISRDVIDMATGEVLLQCNEELTQEKLQEIQDRGITDIELLFIEDSNIGNSLRETLLIDKISTTEEAILEIYRRLRPGDPPNIETATNLFNNLFFNPERYDLSKVGRLKLKYKLKRNAPLDKQVLQKEDFLEAIRYILQLRNGIGMIDDIDHLGNRRVRSVGELLENQFRIGLVRMERAIKERMSLQEVDALMPHDLVNAKPVSAVVKEFFGSSQLSQFMDQTNPLSEVTHKRRLSALGPGGLTRERAGFEVRDVHPTHYGRICPIETPEGPNIGLIASLSTYACINEYGFVETPYRLVENGRVSEKIEFLTALDEEDYDIAQANAPLDEKGYFIRDLISTRFEGEFKMSKPEEVNFMDVSPNQLVSVAASLIPFLENDDANRALMGSNMQRQAVPLLKTEAPLIGTGIEKIVAADSGVTIVAKRDGIVESADASRIVVKAIEDKLDKDDSGVDIYNLIKFQRSNQNTCINQKPIVTIGDFVKKGEVIADGPGIDRGDLALGRNVTVAFMPWGGYNFEDSILISEKVVKNDCFTSIHIEEFDCVARDTKLGKEEITRDIPNVGEDALKDLDESGIIRIGAEVGPGDILVGKVTPKGETQLSPEEKLLRAIFGEKAGDVRDTSFRVPPGVDGIIVNAKVFTRRGVEKDGRTKDIEDRDVAKIRKDQEDEIKIIRESVYDKIKSLLIGKKTSARLVHSKTKDTLISKGKEITEEILDNVPQKYWREISLTGSDKIEKEIEQILSNLDEQIELINMVFNDKIARLKKGDELPPGVIKLVKIFVATKRKLSVGDKMAGRHGNKGVLSRILPEEDMPYLEDGTPVDVVLNPLGVPSRMNVGQILETHIGWASKDLGKIVGNLLEKNSPANQIKKKLKEIYPSRRLHRHLDKLDDEALIHLAEGLKGGVPIATPVFDGASEDEIRDMLSLADLPVVGQTVLHDGRTGERFDHKVTVGIMYLLKLHHLVDDKIHARSIGPYSLVTQQPLGGKAQFGGQRLGEMEVWAMEAYGAAYCLQEFLTVKSDDVAGRTRMYEAIVKGESTLEPGLPESFNVLIKELQSLALDVQLLEEKDKQTEDEGGGGS
ncbi:DNA-directed RNA polymerase subunit beta [Thermodesulfobacteriota bacterium]